jgi:hypothetical protein
VNVPDALFEPLRGKGRTARQALTEVARRWELSPLADGALPALEDAIRHLLRRGQIRRELSPHSDPGALAHAFVLALLEGEGVGAVDRVLPAVGATG